MSINFMLNSGWLLEPFQSYCLKSMKSGLNKEIEILALCTSAPSLHRESTNSSIRSHPLSMCRIRIITKCLNHSESCILYSKEILSLFFFYFTAIFAYDLHYKVTNLCLMLNICLCCNQLFYYQIVTVLAGNKKRCCSILNVWVIKSQKSRNNIHRYISSYM